MQTGETTGRTVFERSFTGAAVVTAVGSGTTTSVETGVSGREMSTVTSSVGVDASSIGGGGSVSGGSFTSSSAS